MTFEGLVSLGWRTLFRQVRSVFLGGKFKFKHSAKTGIATGVGPESSNTNPKEESIQNQMALMKMKHPASVRFQDHDFVCNALTKW